MKIEPMRVLCEHNLIREKSIVNTSGLQLRAWSYGLVEVSWKRDTFAFQVILYRDMNNFLGIQVN